MSDPKETTKAKSLTNGYEVSCLSLNNRLKICLNKEAAEKLRAKMIRYFKQLTTYNLEFINYNSYSQFNDMNEMPLEIYLVNPFVLKLAKRILSHSNVHEQRICYDTYQKTSGFYLTILTLINVELTDNPIMPLCYLVHEENTENVHVNFWSKFVLKHLKNYRIPVAVGRDDAIRTGVIRSLESLENELFFCPNDMCNKVSIFYDTNDLEKTVNFVYIGIENLVDSTDDDYFNKTYDEFKELWPKNYLEYFDREIKPLILSNVFRRKSSKIQMKPLNSTLSIDSIPNESNQFSLTDLIMRLHQSSYDLLIKFNDDYQVKDRIKSEYQSLGFAIKSKYIDYMDKRKQANDLSCIMLFEPNVFQLFHFQIADLAIRNNLIIHDMANDRFLVKSPFDESVNTVVQEDDQGNTVCTCLMMITNVCFHKIAAKFYFLENCIP